jgi:hypothetical protein
MPPGESTLAPPQCVLKDEIEAYEWSCAGSRWRRRVLSTRRASPERAGRDTLSSIRLLCLHSRAGPYPPDPRPGCDPRARPVSLLAPAGSATPLPPAERRLPISHAGSVTVVTRPSLRATRRRRRRVGIHVTPAEALATTSSAFPTDSGSLERLSSALSSAVSSGTSASYASATRRRA